MSLVDGKWVVGPPHRVAAASATGEFVRKESVFRHALCAPGSGGRFEAEAGRYHLFVHVACPWAHRTMVTRAYLGLEGTVSMDVADGRNAEGWAFSPRAAPVTAAPFAAQHAAAAAAGEDFQLHCVYTASDPTCTTRVTVPVLWDTRSRVIVNNESSEIIRMMNAHSRALGGAHAARDLVPPPLAREIDAVNARVFADLNNGVYRAGFAMSDPAYKAARADVFACLDELEARLATSRFLTGDVVTEADVRAFPTLVRFDLAYYGAFGCNLRRLRDSYPNLSGYLRELYALPGWKETVHHKAYLGYYLAAGGRHWKGKPPQPTPEWFEAPSGRRVSQRQVSGKL